MVLCFSRYIYLPVTLLTSAQKITQWKKQKYFSASLAQSHETVENTSFRQGIRRRSMNHLEVGGIDPPGFPTPNRMKLWKTHLFIKIIIDAICCIWRMGASIPLPLACKASALPFELIPHVHMLGIKSSVLLRSTEPAREETNEESQMKL